jgi:hypothetical protein
MYLHDISSRLYTRKLFIVLFHFTVKQRKALFLLLFNFALDQWYSTGGTRRHLRGYVKFKISIYILFHE